MTAGIFRIGVCVIRYDYDCTVATRATEKRSARFVVDRKSLRALRALLSFRHILNSRVKDLSDDWKRWKQQDNKQQQSGSLSQEANEIVYFTLSQQH